MTITTFTKRFFSIIYISYNTERILETRFLNKMPDFLLHNTHVITINQSQTKIKYTNHYINVFIFAIFEKIVSALNRDNFTAAFIKNLIFFFL